MLRTTAAQEMVMMKTHEFPMKIAGVRLTVPRSGTTHSEITHSDILVEKSCGPVSGWVKLKSSLPASVEAWLRPAGGSGRPDSGRSTDGGPEMRPAILPPWRLPAGPNGSTRVTSRGSRGEVYLELEVF
jgi:hypothetical protein